MPVSTLLQTLDRKQTEQCQAGQALQIARGDDALAVFDWWTTKWGFKEFTHFPNHLLQTTAVKNKLKTMMIPQKDQPVATICKLAIIQEVWINHLQGTEIRLEQLESCKSFYKVLNGTTTSKPFEMLVIDNRLVLCRFEPQTPGDRLVACAYLDMHVNFDPQFLEYPVHNTFTVRQFVASQKKRQPGVDGWKMLAAKLMLEGIPCKQWSFDEKFPFDVKAVVICDTWERLKLVHEECILRGLKNVTMQVSKTGGADAEVHAAAAIEQIQKNLNLISQDNWSQDVNYSCPIYFNSNVTYVTTNAVFADRYRYELAALEIDSDLRIPSLNIDIAVIKELGLMDSMIVRALLKIRGPDADIARLCSAISGL